MTTYTTYAVDITDPYLADPIEVSQIDDGDYSTLKFADTEVAMSELIKKIQDLKLSDPTSSSSSSSGSSSSKGASTAQVRLLESRLDLATKTKESFESQLADANDNIRKLENTVSKNAASIIRYEQQIEESQKTINRLTEIGEGSAADKQRNEELKNAHFIEVNNIAVTLKSTQAELGDLKVEMLTLKKTVETLKTENIDLQERISVLQKDYDVLQAKFARLQRDLNASKAEVLRLFAITANIQDEFDIPQSAFLVKVVDGKLTKTISPEEVGNYFKKLANVKAFHSVIMRTATELADPTQLQPLQPIQEQDETNLATLDDTSDSESSSESDTSQDNSSTGSGSESEFGSESDPFEEPSISEPVGGGAASSVPVDTQPVTTQSQSDVTLESSTPKLTVYSYDNVEDRLYFKFVKENLYPTPITLIESDTDIPIPRFNEKVLLLVDVDATNYSKIQETWDTNTKSTDKWKKLSKEDRNIQEGKFVLRVLSGLYLKPDSYLATPGIRNALFEAFSNGRYMIWINDSKGMADALKVPSTRLTAYFKSLKMNYNVSIIPFIQTGDTTRTKTQFQLLDNNGDRIVQKDGSLKTTTFSRFRDTPEVSSS